MILAGCRQGVGETEAQQFEGGDSKERGGRPPLTTVRDFSEGFCGCFSIAGGEETLERFEGSERRFFFGCHS